MKKLLGVIGVIGLLLAMYGLISGIFYSNAMWATYFAIGGILLLGYLNYKFKNESILKIWEKDKLKVVKIYLIYLIITIIIEIVGKFILNLWEWPYFNLVDEIIYVFLLGYPFGFFFIYEFFIFLKTRVKSFSLTFILTALITCFLYEYPNIFVWEWVYKIPYVTFEILQINIVVIVGWAILTAVPLVVMKICRRG